MGSKVEELARRTGVKGGGPITVMVKVGRKDPYPERNPDLAADIALGAALDEEIKVMKAELDAVNDRVRGYAEGLDADVGTVRLGAEANGVPVEAKVTSRSTVNILDMEGLQECLGARFDDLVRTKVDYKPTSRLVELAVAGEDEARKYLEVVRPKATVAYERPDK